MMRYRSAQTRQRVPAYLPIIIFLTYGCTSGSEDSADTNIALITLQTNIPVQYRLNQFSLQDDLPPGNKLLKWSSQDPIGIFQANPSLIEGSHSLDSLLFSYHVPGSGDYRPESPRYCQSDCQGTSMTSLDMNNRKLVIEMNMNFAADIEVCTTRHCLTVSPDNQSVYATCKDSSECSSVFDIGKCHCRNVLPCKGNTARDASELCPNPDYKIDKLGVSVTAHAELTEEMLQSE